MTSPSSPPRKVGVEERILLVDPDAGELPSVAAHVLHEHRAATEGDAPTLTRLGTLGGGSRRHRQAFQAQRHRRRRGLRRGRAHRGGDA